MAERSNMLKKFTVYLKKGEPLTLEFRRFTFDANGFTVFDSYNDAVPNLAFLSIDHIAAIIPEEQRESDSRFKVILRNGQSFEVVAEVFKTDQPPSVRFCWQQYSHRQEEIQNIYVALSEVVAVMPVNGLQRE
jgi:predicted 3-demethylubiquinone-9 3-methyltransferase (glyoxalase superfamily)